jgi:hypothetical protein
MKQKTSKPHWDDNICPPNPPQADSSSNPYQQQLESLKRKIKESEQKLATILKLYSSKRKAAILKKIRVDIQNMAHIDPRKQIKLFEDFESLLSKWVDLIGRCVSNKEFEKELDVFNNEYKSLIQRKKLFEDIGGKKAPGGKAGDGKNQQHKKTLEGEWSNPMTKSAMMSRVGIDGYKKFNTFAKQYGLRKAGNRQLWQIRLDNMDENTRKKFEKA